MARACGSYPQCRGFKSLPRYTIKSRNLVNSRVLDFLSIKYCHSYLSVYYNNFIVARSDAMIKAADSVVGSFSIARAST